MGMYDTVRTVKRGSVWEHEHEFTTERVVLQKNGAFRYEDLNGGEAGAWENREDTVREISAQEAVNILRSWGISDEEISGVKALERFSAA